MPLIKGVGKQAFSANVRAEIAAGRPQKQAIAIAYSVKRAAGKPKKQPRRFGQLGGDRG